jgi:hypothetical protein
MATAETEGSAEQAGDEARVTEQETPAADTEASAAAGQPELDEVKRKFREVLDRKKGQHSAAGADGAQAAGKVHGSHGPASTRRSFRRKSGS